MPQKRIGYYLTLEVMESSNGKNANNLIVDVLIIGFTGLTTLIMWLQYKEQRELSALQKELVAIQLQKEKERLALTKPTNGKAG